MRSNDVIYGVTNDIFFFGILHQMVFVYLKSWYPDLILDTYTHMANSMHVYNNHYKMLENIISNPNNWDFIDYPDISGVDEVDWLRYCQGQEIPENFKFAKWLNS
jgi:thymidylate synthase